MNFKKNKLLQLFPAFIFLITVSMYGQDIKKLNIVKSQAIDSILLSKKAYNAKNLPNGYKIQLYYGNETVAYRIKNRFKQNFPNLNADIVFETPDWKVMVGNFRRRIVADSIILPIKKKFIGAIVVEAPISFE